MPADDGAAAPGYGIIDAHMHLSRVKAFSDFASEVSGVDYTEEGHRLEAASCGIIGSVCMGVSERVPGSFPDAAARSPMRTGPDAAALKLSHGSAGVNAPKPGEGGPRTDGLPRAMGVCLGINPHTLDEGALMAADMLCSDEGAGVVGLKAYLGYYHVDAYDPVYAPAYDLAERHGLPVAFHTGETFAQGGLLEYSHPLRLDRLAVARPNLRIVICHVGVPWVFDACEVACKNRNVFVDLSGLLIGNAAYIDTMASKPLLSERYAQALTFLDDYGKVLFGTDWPLAPMGAYLRLCMGLVPPEARRRVFRDNALKVYDRLPKALGLPEPNP
ncbi:MAG: amidohydrolase family protein [Oscillospiraceae bacterium]|nr:amidohydrolase family protein [Oscillospiraceae bacterium]